ncbi:MAG: YdcF family protein [Actinobacteria bacterium]|nr:YdcF family protein [Actinomycetota bacterium]
MRWSVRLIAVVLLASVAYLTITFAQIWLAARRNHAHPVEAIIVLGAAQYDGRPSPVLRARLDHAADLYARGLADVIVVTGGRAPGDRFTEATAAAVYLHGRGVPDSAIRREVEGDSSYESIAASALFLRREGLTEVLLVSDPFHNYRIVAIAEDVGLDAAASATPDSPIRGEAALKRMLRETVAVSFGRILGYRRVTTLVQR